jgi:hypothetical protein
MDLSAFKQSLSGNFPPETFSLNAQALWYDGKENWEKAHQLVQDLSGSTAALIHAYLHRKEGDNWNADYWYNRARKKRPVVSLAEEWEQLVAAML